MFADGYYRYPENEDFRKNCLASFYNSLHINWMSKQWPQTAQLIDEVLALKAFKEDEDKQLKLLLHNWMNYFRMNNNINGATAVSSYMKRMSE